MPSPKGSPTLLSAPCSNALRALGVFALTLLLCSNACAGEPPLTTVLELQQFVRADIPHQPPVRVRGTVTLRNEGYRSRPNSRINTICIEDGPAGIWLIFDPRSNSIWEGTDADLQNIQVGDEIEIEGVLDPGAYAPNIHPRTIKVLGKKPLSTPYLAPLDALFTGNLRTRRVETSGVVQDVSEEDGQSSWLLKVETGVDFFLMRVPKIPEFSPERLLDAEIQVTGISVAVRNWRGEFVRPRIIPSRAEDIVIRTPPPSDPFAVKYLPLNQLNHYVPGGRPKHRRRTEGIVTYADPGTFLIIQEGACSVRVDPVQSTPVAPGDRIEASGFIDRSRTVADLGGALVRKVGTGSLPAPVPLSLTEIESDFHNIKSPYPTSTQPSGFEGILATITGRLLSVQTRHNERYAIELDCGDSISTAFLRGPIPNLQVGSLLQLTGAAALQYKQSLLWASPTRLDLLLRGPKDITVLSTPSWWTNDRIRNALFGVLALALTGFSWAAILQRTVKKRTLQLAQEMRNRRDAAIEFEAALRERSRLAANLHDTVLQTVTGLALQIETCNAHLDPGQKTVAGHLDMALKMARSGQKDLRNSVWALHSLPLKENTFSEAVRAVARQISTGHPIQVDVVSEGETPPLADFVAGNLLLIVQEAIHNTIKHARATQIQVTLSIAANGTRYLIQVQDNGSGFQPGTQHGTESGHFGINGMRERAERLGGSFQIQSQPGAGTCIRIEVPLGTFDHALV